MRSAEMIELGTDKVVVGVQFRFYADRLHEPKNRSLIESLSSKLSARSLKLECQVTGKTVANNEPKEDLVETVVEVFQITE